MIWKSTQNNQTYSVSEIDFLYAEIGILHA